jgi:hypothetical protein
MSRFTIPEEVIGVPLWVPDANNFFEIEESGMPNGDPCLVMRGDINPNYKAFLPAPTMSPVNVLKSSDTQVGREWSMSCWLKVPALSLGAAAQHVMFGCSTYTAVVNQSTENHNLDIPFMVQPYSTNGFYVFREPLNNLGSGNNQTIRWFGTTGNTGFHLFLDYWVLVVINYVTTFSSPNFSVIGEMYFDTYLSANISDSSAGTAASGAFNSPSYLHIGAYHSIGQGRADLWRMAKWAFHDHALTQAERIAMWQAMYGTVITFADDFNRASIGSNWRGLVNSLAITGDEVRVSGATDNSSFWVKDLGSSDMYSEGVVTENTGWVKPVCRVQSYGNPNLNHYRAGWVASSGLWDIERYNLAGGATSLANTSVSPPTGYPYTLRLECETVAGDVELRLYQDGVLKLSTTDTSGSKVLNASNAGLSIRGASGPTVTRVTNFECGTL